ncbi:hypothetical protein SpCBS45565_g00971 [Spizellomyces sp. 'palustris']|nr:hypothetical protein SpCBS45565_g00971 [Spizellomyces sp. 'palustris']
MPTLVRPVDGVVRYLVAASVLGYHNCITASIRLRPLYSQSSTVSSYHPHVWGTAVHRALCDCLAMHACLWTVVLDATSATPKYALLDNGELSLKDAVKVVQRGNDVGEDQAVRRCVELEVNTPFDLVSKTPLFRVTVILPHESELGALPSLRPSVDIVVSMHHVVGDGKSLVSFCKTLVTNLRHGTLEDVTISLPARPGGPESVASLRKLAPATGLSIVFLLYVGLLELAKRVSIIGRRFFGLGYWRGNNVKYNIHDSGRCRVLDFELNEMDMESLSDLCKSRKTSLHATISAACTLACARISSPTSCHGKRPITIRTNHTICLRPSCNPPVPNTIIGNFASGCHTDLVLQDPAERVPVKHFWEMARTSVRQLRIGWAWWALRIIATMDLVPDYHAFHTRENTLQCSVTISNLGRIEFEPANAVKIQLGSSAEPTAAHWEVESASGAQTAHPFWGPYTIVLATVRGKMKVTLVYREKVLGDDLEAKRFLLKLKEVFHCVITQSTEGI